MRLITGQVFVRDTGNPGLMMVVGIFQRDPTLQKEAIHVAQIHFVPDTAEDVADEARGSGIGDVLTSPLWRVQPREV
jgi:hypothetical protein